MGRVLKFVAKWAALLIIGLIITGLIYQQIGLRRDEANFPMPGRMVDVGDHELHLYCMGEGSDAPTVLLEGGASFISTGWRWVMEGLAPTTQVCAYDRAGMGWSDEGTHPYDGHQASDELHALIQNAGFDGPIILVGHSLGAMIGRIHYDRYPEDLAGLVMIEPADPDIFLSDYAEERGHAAERTTGIRPCSNRCTMVNVANTLGVVRLAFGMVDLLDDPLFPIGAAEAYIARTSRGPNARQPMASGRYITRTVFQTRDNTSLGDLPVMGIYSTGFGSLLGTWDSEEDRIADLDLNLAAWERTVATSSNNMGVRGIEGANHLAIIGYEEYASQVAAHVREMIAFVQGVEE